MTMRKAFSWLLVAALALSTVPATAQTFPPNTIWGQVPQGLSGNVSSVVLLDLNGNVVATVPVVDGRFEFRDVVPGNYTVQLKDATGGVLATSPTVNLTGGGVVKVIFTGNAIVGAVPPAGGHSTALIVAGGAIAIGIGTAIVINNSKNNPPNSPKK